MFDVRAASICRFQTVMGHPEAARECLLKRVRALGGTGWQGSQETFETYAHASLALCRAYLQVCKPGCWTALVAF